MNHMRAYVHKLGCKRSACAASFGGVNDGCSITVQHARKTTAYRPRAKDFESCFVGFGSFLIRTVVPRCSPSCQPRRG
eukprot:533346-Prorocentrum_minimum.AAC.2